MKWPDSLDLTLTLIDKYPQQDLGKIRFTDLREWILTLPDFDDHPDHCSERVLEAVQQCWIAEI